MTPHLGMPEGIVIGLFVVLALGAMAVPSSLLSGRDFDEMVPVYSSETDCTLSTACWNVLQPAVGLGEYPSTN